MGLSDPIVIESRDEFQIRIPLEETSRSLPIIRSKTSLPFGGALPVTLLADGVGLGKTISAGLVTSELIARNRVDRILIGAPKLLGPSGGELGRKFDIAAEVVTGGKLVSTNLTTQRPSS